MDWVRERTFSWSGEPAEEAWRHYEFTADRLAYVLMTGQLGGQVGSITYQDSAAIVQQRVGYAGVPIRNQVNRVQLDWGTSDLIVVLRGTDAFGELLLHLLPAQGSATAWSITINRMMKGGVSHSSPMPEEQQVARIGRFTFPPLSAGRHSLVVEAIEEQVRLSVDGQQVLEFRDPDVAAGLFALGTTGSVRLLSIEQDELITPEEAQARAAFVERMTAFCAALDAEYPADVGRCNQVRVERNRLTWASPNTGARVELRAAAGNLTGSVRAGLYGDARLFDGPFGHPEIVAQDGSVWTVAPEETPSLTGDNTHLAIRYALRNGQGQVGTLVLRADFSETTVWFWTAEIDGPQAQQTRLEFALDPAFTPNQQAADPSPVLQRTDHRVGYHWQSISGQDTQIALETHEDAAVLVLHSGRSRFRWASMWLPAQKLNLTGYKTRMLHFIRYPETPVQEWREQPSVHQYPTDEELLRYAHHGVDVMVWHHTWVNSNFRRREGFLENRTEMRRAMRKAHELGIAVIGYVGIVPGRHPVLRYQDLAGDYGKNWDLQDFTFYSVAGRFADFLPYMTDYWCREYGLDGFYVDGGLAGLSWGKTGLTEADCGGLSLEELNHRLYSRVRRVLRRHGAGFGLECWGGAAIQLVAGFYDCRMIGESFQEAPPEHYRDSYNPLLTGTPFKMYAMDLVARNRYNVAMAAVCMTDIQLCSGNYAWGNWPDRPSDWANLRPWWAILDSIEWDVLLDAQPWWSQALLPDPEEAFYCGYYLLPQRAVVMVANRSETRRTVTTAMNTDVLPAALRKGQCRMIYPEHGDPFPVGRITLDLPRLHDGPVGFEIVP